MCSRYAETQCCVCRRYLDKSNSRIIVEICGHQKCRECFIKEEDGCSLCSQNKEKFEEINESSSHEDISNIYIRPSHDSSEGMDGSKTKNSTIIEIDEVAAHIITTKDTGDAVRYKCTICQKSFKSRNNRRYHLFCDKTRSKPFQCNQCDCRFITVAHLNYHQTTHSTNKHLSCPHCQKIYSGEIALKKHLRKHQNDFKYECAQCDEKFLYKEQLNIHQNRHNNIYHKCPECGKRFLIKSNLTKHIQSHSGLNRKVCSICKNSFSGNSALKTHMLTHSKVKKHQCDKCMKKFIDQRTLERHWKTHLDNAFYECTLCTAKSGRKDNIRRHVRNLHTESEDELQSILQTIFDNFAKKKNQSNLPKENKTEQSEIPIKHSEVNDAVDYAKQDINQSKSNGQTVDFEIANSSEDTNKSAAVRNIATSVIKFVGRSQNVQTAQNTEKPLKELGKSSEIETTGFDISDKLEPPSKHKPAIVNETSGLNPIAATGVDLTSLEPMSFDQFPAIAPLPLLNTNTNLNIYRQLLSPYLKKTTEPINNGPNVESTESKRRINEDLKPKSAPAAIVIDRPPKKMINKYQQI